MKLRKVLIVAGGLFLLGCSALAIWIMLLDVKDITALVERKVEAATGRQLHIAGPVTLKVSLIPTLAIEGVRFQNAPWGSQPDMLSVKRADVQLAILPLFRRQVSLRKIILIEPKILLEVNGKGEKNWEFKTATEDRTERRKLAIDIAELRIEDGVFEYRSGTPVRSQKMGIEILSLESSSDEKATIETRLIANAVPIQIAGGIPNPMRFGSSTSHIDLKVEIGGATLALAGEIPAQETDKASTTKPSPLEGLNLKFTAAADDPSNVAKQFKVTLPRLPKTQIEGVVRVAKSMLEMDLVKFQSGRSSAHGKLSMPMQSERSSVSVNLDAPLVDLRELLGPITPPSKTKKVEPGGRLFSDDALPLKSLTTADVRADIKVAQLVLRDGRPVQGLAAKVDLQHGKLVADPLSISVEGKPLRARVVADASSGRTMAIDLTLDGKNIALASLAALANVSAVPQGAPTDIAVRFISRGASVRQLMAGADGDVRVVVGPGRWKGDAFAVGADITELFKAILPDTGAGDYTELQCAAIRFPIKQGMARIENGIGIETTKVKVLAFGTVDLRSEAIKLGFRPKAATGLGVSAGSLAQLVRVGGTLSNPGVEVDPVGTATTLLEIGLAVSTSGASLLGQKLFMADKSLEHPCQTALEKGQSASNEVRGERNKEAKKGGKAPNEPASDNPIDAVRRLFGG